MFFVVTEDDRLKLPKSLLDYAPLRVDFAGGWLDVPKHAREDGFIVNAAISPLVSLQDWPYHKNAGLGGSGAWALLNGRDSVQAELDLGVGWQDPAVIRETGVCVWKSGEKPDLVLKSDGQFLRGLMALKWSGQEHDTPGLVDVVRDYSLIAKASTMAAQAVQKESVEQLAEAVRLSYEVQLDEGMAELSEDSNALAQKYCGGGHGGYVIQLYASKKERAIAAKLERLLLVEPFLAG